MVKPSSQVSTAPQVFLVEPGVQDLTAVPPMLLFPPLVRVPLCLVCHLEAWLVVHRHVAMVVVDALQYIASVREERVRVLAVERIQSLPVGLCIAFALRCQGVLRFFLFIQIAGIRRDVLTHGPPHLPGGADLLLLLNVVYL